MKCKFGGLSFLFVVHLCYGDQSTTLIPKRCPGGFSEGAIVELGHYWYECKETQLIPRGCVDNGRRMEIYETFDSASKDYRFQCVIDSNGLLAFAYKSCLYNGLEYRPAEEWDDDKFFYRCDKEDDHLRINVAGCVDQGRRVGINERVTKGDFVYQCRQSNTGTCRMCPVACTKYGKVYGIGDNFEIDNFWYTCTNTDSRGPLVIKCIGCVGDNKQRLADGERYFKDDVVYECAVRQQEAGIRPVACLQRDRRGSSIERRLGCYWVEGEEPYQYEMTCKEQKETNTAIKVRNRCSYKVQGGAYTIDPNCYQIVEKTAVGCKNSSGSLNIVTVQMDQVVQLSELGFRYC